MQQACQKSFTESSFNDFEKNNIFQNDVIDRRESLKNAKQRIPKIAKKVQFMFPAEFVQVHKAEEHFKESLKPKKKMTIKHRPGK